jgi:hypothetical protein
MRPVAIAVGLAASLAARGDVGRPEPPLVPEGIADAGGRLAFVRAREAGIAAVDLATGEVRWSSSEGEWPLHADPSTVAVAAVDPASAGTLRVRFLRVTDGRRVRESGPIALPDGLRIPDPRKLPGRTTPGFTVRAWTAPSTPGGRDGRLRVRWEWSFTPVYGFRPPSPPETRRASGIVLIDPATGEVLPGKDDERQASPPAELPPAFRPDPQLVYFSFSDHGAAWSSAPTPFRIADGAQGAFAYEPRGERRLWLVRWRSGALLPPLELGHGAEYGPVIAMGGRFVALSEQKDRRERLLLHDLAGDAAVPVAELPPFGRLCMPPFAVVGERMLCVREDEGQAIEGGTSFARALVAIRVPAGERAWSMPVAPRLLPAPVPGGGR